MSRHIASLEAERPVPAKVAEELVPRPDTKNEAAISASLPAAPVARNGAIRAGAGSDSYTGLRGW